MTEPTFASKLVDTSDGALEGLTAGSTLLVGGWGGIGIPQQLIEAVARSGIGDLRVVSNNCGMGEPGDIGAIFAAGLVSRVIATFPTHPAAREFHERYDAGEVDVEIVPQGTLAERLRSAGAGLGGFYTPTAAGTPLGEGRESRMINGREHILESPLPGDFAIIKATQADAMGNLRFTHATRGFNPIMAMAAAVTVVQADELVPVGSMPPDDVHLPGIFVNRVVITESVA